MAKRNDDVGLAGFLAVIAFLALIVIIISAIVGGIIVGVSKNKKEHPKAAKNAFKAAWISAIIFGVCAVVMLILAAATGKGPYDG
jgi:ABC-type Fe3+ transport system permease subunit